MLISEKRKLCQKSPKVNVLKTVNQSILVKAYFKRTVNLLADTLVCSVDHEIGLKIV